MADQDALFLDNDDGLDMGANAGEIQADRAAHNMAVHVQQQQQQQQPAAGIPVRERASQPGMQGLVNLDVASMTAEQRLQLLLQLQQHEAQGQPVQGVAAAPSPALMQRAERANKRKAEYESYARKESLHPEAMKRTTFQSDWDMGEAQYRIIHDMKNQAWTEYHKEQGRKAAEGTLTYPADPPPSFRMDYANGDEWAVNALPGESIHDRYARNEDIKDEALNSAIANLLLDLQGTAVKNEHEATGKDEALCRKRLRDHGLDPMWLLSPHFKEDGEPLSESDMAFETASCFLDWTKDVLKYVRGKKAMFMKEEVFIHDVKVGRNNYAQFLLKDDGPLTEAHMTDVFFKKMVARATPQLLIAPTRVGKSGCFEYMGGIALACGAKVVQSVSTDTNTKSQMHSLSEKMARIGLNDGGHYGLNVKKIGGGVQQAASLVGFDVILSGSTHVQTHAETTKNYLYYMHAHTEYAVVHIVDEAHTMVKQDPEGVMQKLINKMLPNCLSMMVLVTATPLPLLALGQQMWGKLKLTPALEERMKNMKSVEISEFGKSDAFRRLVEGEPGISLLEDFPVFRTNIKPDYQYVEEVFRGPDNAVSFDMNNGHHKQEVVAMASTLVPETDYPAEEGELWRTHNGALPIVNMKYPPETMPDTYRRDSDGRLMKKDFDVKDVPDFLSAKCIPPSWEFSEKKRERAEFWMTMMFTNHYYKKLDKIDPDSGKVMNDALFWNTTKAVVSELHGNLAWQKRHVEHAQSINQPAFIMVNAASARSNRGMVDNVWNGTLTWFKSTTSDTSFEFKKDDEVFVMPVNIKNADGTDYVGNMQMHGAKSLGEGIAIAHAITGGRGAKIVEILGTSASAGTTIQNTIGNMQYICTTKVQTQSAQMEKNATAVVQIERQNYMSEVFFQGFDVLSTKKKVHDTQDAATTNNIFAYMENPDQHCTLIILSIFFKDVMEVMTEKHLSTIGHGVRRLKLEQLVSFPGKEVKFRSTRRSTAIVAIHPHNRALAHPGPVEKRPRLTIRNPYVDPRGNSGTRNGLFTENNMKARIKIMTGKTDDFDGKERELIPGEVALSNEGTDIRHLNFNDVIEYYLAIDVDAVTNAVHDYSIVLFKQKNGRDPEDPDHYKGRFKQGLYGFCMLLRNNQQLYDVFMDLKNNKHMPSTRAVINMLRRSDGAESDDDAIDLNTKAVAYMLKLKYKRPGTRPIVNNDLTTVTLLLKNWMIMNRVGANAEDRLAQNGGVVQPSGAANSSAAHAALVPMQVGP